MTKYGKTLVSAAVLFLLFALCSGFAYAEGGKTGTTTGDSLNLRESPSTSAKILTQVSKGTQVTIIDSKAGWYKVNFSSLTGWLSAEYVVVKDTAAIGSGVITGDSVNVRSGPSKSSDIVTRLGEGDKVSILSRSADWYSIKTADGTLGWVYKDFILIRNSNSSRGEEQPREKAVESDSSTGAKVVEYAKKFLGVKYVYGGTSPKGFDCSGFTQYVYSHFGIDLERVAASQAKQGDAVKRANLKAGDLVFFDTDGGHNYICHAGIYIGDGRFIHASSGQSTHKVTTSSLSEEFYSNAFMTARRFID